MTGIVWDPPVIVAVALGLTGLLAWLALAPPGQGGRARGAARVVAALLLALALLDVGCRAGGAVGRGRLVVLVDRSRSMEVAEPGGPTRAEAGRSWLGSEPFRAWTRGWSVTVDSFGGVTTDPGAAIAAAEATLPDAIVVVTDGRAAGGRVAEPGSAPVFARVPAPVTVVDAAVLDLAVVAPEEGSPRIEATIAAVGGREVRDTGLLVVLIDGRAAGRVAVGRLAVGERRSISIPWAAGGGERIVEARREGPPDAMAANDARALVWAAEPGPRRALVLGLRPGWELAPWRRALADVHPGPVDAFWAARPGELRPVDGGRAVTWDALDPGRYGAAYLFGDPLLLAERGRSWLGRFLAAGGRGLLWAPEGAAGALIGAEVTVESGARAAIPVLTEAGRGWLAARGAAPAPAAGPDGRAPWPSIEALPAGTQPPPGAVPLLTAGGQPVAWAAERGTNRVVVVLGTGTYRWPIAAPRDPAGGAAFWALWTGAIGGWLAAAAPASRPLVRLPAGGRLADGEPLDAAVAADVAADVEWRIERTDAAGASEATAVAAGTVAAGPAPRAIRAGPFPPGAYRLLATAPGRQASHRLIVEEWSSDLATTAADTASLAAAARASGGALIGPAPPPLPRATASATGAGGRAVGLGTTPWAYLAAALLLLVDWALGARPALAQPRRAE